MAGPEFRLGTSPAGTGPRARTNSRMDSARRLDSFRIQSGRSSASIRGLRDAGQRRCRCATHAVRVGCQSPRLFHRRKPNSLLNDAPGRWVFDRHRRHERPRARVWPRVRSAHLVYCSEHWPYVPGLSFAIWKLGATEMRSCRCRTADSWTSDAIPKLTSPTAQVLSGHPDPAETKTLIRREFIATAESGR